MFTISSSFALYIAEQAPSLFWQLPLDNLAFRWKIPSEEYLGGFIGKSGIDSLKDLHTDELCGFTTLHFPGREFIELYLITKGEGRYTPIMVIDSLLEFYLNRYKYFNIDEQSKNQFVDHFTGETRSRAVKATEQGCLLRYANDKTEEPIILTRKGFYNLFPPKTAH